MATTAYYGTRLSPHISRTPEGYVIAHDVPLCRTAERVPMLYRGSEVGLPTDDTVEVYRSAKEVLSSKHIASIEAKPVLDGHTRFVTSDTASWSTKGHVQNVRTGPVLPDGEKSVIGDIIITDATLAQKVLDGRLREISLGYNCRYLRNSDGTLSQVKLRVNHLALVENGRAGSDIRIYDAAFVGSFAEMARRYHRRDPVSVAAGVAEQRATDRLPEALRSGEPHSWDELAKTLEIGENEMADTPNKYRPALQNLTQILEEYFSDPEEQSEDESPALQHLRAIKPEIQASGNRKAIDAYNAAVRAIKRDQRRVLAVDTRTPQQRVADAAWWQKLQAEVNPDHSFVDAARRAGARMRGESVPEAEAHPARDRVQDSSATDESWADTHREAGRKMREKKH